MRREKRRLAGFMAALMMVSGLGLGGCGAEESGSLYEQIQERGTLRVGMNAEFAPYEFHMNIDNKDQVVGLDVSLAQAIADDLGVDLEIQEMEFSPLIQNLNAGQVDIVISALVPSEERKQQVDFSDIYFYDSNVALISADKADQFRSIEDLMGTRICYQLGSYQEAITKEVFGDEELTVLDSTNTILLGIQADQIDAFITSTIVAEQAMAASPDNYTCIESDQLQTDTDGCAVAVPKGEEDLVEKINETIQRLVDSGEMDAYVEEACEQAANNVGE